MDSLQMLTQAQLMKLLNCSESHVTFLREMGIIPAIRTGRNYMFSPRQSVIFIWIMRDWM